MGTSNTQEPLWAMAGSECNVNTITWQSQPPIALSRYLLHYHHHLNHPESPKLHEPSEFKCSYTYIVFGVWKMLNDTQRQGKGCNGLINPCESFSNITSIESLSKWGRYSSFCVTCNPWLVWRCKCCVAQNLKFSRVILNKQSSTIWM